MLLTTQYLEEADQLADRIAVIDRGRVIADGHADGAQGALGGDRIDVVVRDAARPGRARGGACCGGATPRWTWTRGGSARRSRDRMARADDRAVRCASAAIEAEDIALRRPTLDEVFLDLTAPTGAGPTRRTVGGMSSGSTLGRRRLLDDDPARRSRTGPGSRCRSLRRAGVPGHAAADVRLPARRRRGAGGGDYPEFLVPGCSR